MSAGGIMQLIGNGAQDFPPTFVSDIQPCVFMGDKFTNPVSFEWWQRLRYRNYLRNVIRPILQETTNLSNFIIEQIQSDLLYQFKPKKRPDPNVFIRTVKPLAQFDFILTMRFRRLDVLEKWYLNQYHVLLKSILPHYLERTQVINSLFHKVEREHDSFPLPSNVMISVDGKIRTYAVTVNYLMMSSGNLGLRYCD